jgi:NTE family protein
LIKIGLRAVDILQSEVSINDLSNATMINDLLAARESVFRELEAQGISGAQATTILRALDAGLAKYQFAPIRVVEPDKEFSDTLEFDPIKIREAIQAGRDSVDHAWGSLEPFLT